MGPVHPNLGWGGCQALEDALALADALGAHADPSAACAAYQTARWRRASAVTMLARWFGEMAQLGGPLRHLRDALAGTTPGFVVRPVLRWVMTPPRLAVGQALVGLAGGSLVRRPRRCMKRAPVA